MMEALRALCARGCLDAREYSPYALAFAFASCLLPKVLQHASFPSGISFSERAATNRAVGILALLRRRPRAAANCSTL